MFRFAPYVIIAFARHVCYSALVEQARLRTANPDSLTMQPKVITFVDKPKELAQLKQASLEEVKERLRPIKESLPIYLEKKVLVDAVKKNKCLIVVGETGSGKTTQLPQYLYEAGFAYRGAIACTQPRRVAAITVAQRVAQVNEKSPSSLCTLYDPGILCIEMFLACLTKTRFTHCDYPFGCSVSIGNGG